MSCPTVTGYRFHHALVREVLYNSIMLNQRRGLHLQVGEALLNAPGPDPDALAGHFQRAGDARAAEWLVRSGNQAEKALRPANGHRAFRGSRCAAGRAGRTLQRPCGWLHFRLSRLKGGHDLRASLAHIEEALRVADQTRDRYLAARSLVTKGLHLCFTGNIRQGIVEMEQWRGGRAGTG